METRAEKTCRRCGRPSDDKYCQPCLWQRPKPLFRGTFYPLFWVLLISLFVGNVALFRWLKVDFTLTIMIGPVVATLEQIAIVMGVEAVRTALWVRRGR